MPGLSYINYADYCTFQNLKVTTGTGGATVSILSGSLNSLKTRQLADSVRIKVAKGSSSLHTAVVSFDVLVPSSTPNVFSQTLDYLRNVRLFGLFGFKFIQTPEGGTTFPFNPDTEVTLYGYNDADPEGHAAVWTTGSQQLSSYADLDVPALGMSVPYSALEVMPTGHVVPLLDSSGGATMFYDTQGWGADPTDSDNLRSFRVSIILYAGIGDIVFDIGRLWIGNGFTPQNGFSGVSKALVDQSNVTVSRDSQAYPQYFDTSSAISVFIPAMTETEAVGVGPTPSTQVGADDPVAISNCLDFAMRYLGTSRECVLWLHDATSLSQVAANLRFRSAVYGRVTNWQPLTWVQARANSKPAQTTTGRVYSGGMTVQSEG